MRSKLLAALLVSEAVHLMFFGILAEVTIGPPREYAFNVAGIYEEDEIGNDPDLPTNYNVDRIEEIDVPGPLPEEALPPGEAFRPWTR